MFKIIVLSSVGAIVASNYISKDQLLTELKEQQELHPNKTVYPERMSVLEKFHKDLKVEANYVPVNL